MRAEPHRISEILRALQSLKVEAQAAPGLVRAGLYLDAEDPGCLSYIEEWDTADAVREVRAAGHLARLFGLTEESSGAPTLQVNEIVPRRDTEFLRSLLGDGSPPKMIR